jgi:hypothetical protein
VRPLLPVPTSVPTVPPPNFRHPTVPNHPDILFADDSWARRIQQQGQHHHHHQHHRHRGTYRHV